MDTNAHEKAYEFRIAGVYEMQTVNIAPTIPAGSDKFHRFFQKVDWTAFGLTTGLSLMVYWFTLSPGADLEFSGIFSTAAMYLGVSNPPAYPLWTIYTWLFVKLLPFENVAWRVAVATAVSSAVTCGLIALMVSRVGILIAESVSSFKNLSAREQKAVRLVCGCVAGLGFGLDTGFWRRAVVADQWNFNVFLFALTLCLLLRWFFTPQQKRYFYAAALMQGLMIGDSQALFPTAFALPFLVVMGDLKLGREIFFGIGIFLALILAGPLNGFLDYIGPQNREYVIGMAVVAWGMWLALSVWTRGFLSEWKTTSVATFLFFVGVGVYLLLPVISMTDPPVNWGYPRTVEGFFHVINRGQYGRGSFANSFGALVTQWIIYGRIAADDYGLVYLLAAAVPFLRLHKATALVRRWLIGALIVWFFISLLMVVGLNLTNDRATIEAVSPFFTVTHLLLAMFAGYGLILVAAIFGRPNPTTS